MKRLIDKGLMFGNLIRVESPALIERYNRALQKLTGKTTGLDAFHIDISGYSPEVGDELGNSRYLNPNGVNRQFILLSPEQKTAPLLEATFSTERAILREFIEANEAQLFSLTARDAVLGEVEDTVYSLETPAQLIGLRYFNVAADTTGNHVAEAEKLAGLITRFRTDPAGWYDDALIGEMITLADKTGDVTRHPVKFGKTQFDAPDFWTSHFGGVYLFRTPRHKAVIGMGELLQGLPHDMISGTDRNAIARFLDVNGLVEPIVKARGTDAGAILRQKMDFILVSAAAELGLPIGAGDRRALRGVAGQLGSVLPREFEALAALLRWVEAGGAWPEIDSNHPAYFYTLRARPGPLRDLVNRLLAELSPLDVRQLFICHKELFYRLYAGWPEVKKAWVAEFLETEYQIDKAGARKRLFGSEPGMEEATETAKAPVPVQAGPWGSPRKSPPPPLPSRDPIDLVGPWGAVLRGRT
ncbi:hypothetical protein C8J27_102211 [Rhodobacter aestuarii]|uniref:Uncharacterized protein n=1 Tax=Rhodobacter aestuarii TaxID=453582 RepID=A0A1N7NEW2_9RHOB|nr:MULTISPECIES: DUF6638 family protein [Rhodobacter]PTV96417.1 hypothetical protein C8J27_102211 [Rhodobacter aestuarii]SIS96798.1 hypothetical protein SAMN05421580_107211 [Rhodobacter aestuarii]SOB92274.1 hypothetical protein SAMN05877809_101522 [Rhodobacter sp. JA431]